MAPPKKDAFSDLFQSATASSSSSSVNNRNLSLLERKQQSGSNSSVNQWNFDILSSRSSSPNPGSNSPFTGNPGSNSPHFNGSLHNGSVHNGSGSTGSSGINTSIQSKTPVDPFDIFNTPSQQSPTKPTPPTSQPAPTSQSAPTKPTPSTSQPAPTNQPAQSRIDSPSLLDDDEFIDAFTPPSPQPDQPQHYSQLQSDLSEDSDEDNAPTSISHASNTSLDKKDTVIAELVDIGFSIDMANQAIAKMGPDLQACVNYIMSGADQANGKSKTRQSSQRPANSRQNSQQGDLVGSINDLSMDFFNKASFFFNKSKDTVMKNIEQFQQNQTDRNLRGRGSSGSGSGNENLPAWMKTQHKYKNDALERRRQHAGENFEDYGSDDENINQDEINRFMQAQKQKEKERQKQRIEHFKEVAKNKINGGENSGRSSPLKKPMVPPSQNHVSQPPTESNPAIRQPHPQRPPKPKQASPAPSQLTSDSRQSQRSATPAVEPEVDLLGLGGKNGNANLSRAERFKSSSASEDQVYVSSRRRRNVKTNSASRHLSSEALNQFQQSDYDTSKQKATELFNNGDYNSSHESYVKCLEALPANHELRVIIHSNLALTSIKSGDYKTAKKYCDGGLDLIGHDDNVVKDATWIINDKPIKFWYTKLLTRKAESLEMLESFPDSLKCYSDLVTKYGVNDKKVMDARRRVRNIVDPPAVKKQPTPKPVTQNQTSNYEAVERIKKQNAEEKAEEELKFSLHDQIQAKLFDWSNGKEDNLRTLLMSLPNILPERLGFPFLTNRKITLNDLMLPKKVKINYMKVISSIHPDKLGGMPTEDQMICQGVFIILNKSWETFKQQNGMN